MKTEKQIFDEVSKSHDRSWKRDRTLWTLRFNAATLTTQASDIWRWKTAWGDQIENFRREKIDARTK